MSLMLPLSAFERLSRDIASPESWSCAAHLVNEIKPHKAAASRCPSRNEFLQTAEAFFSRRQLAVINAGPEHLELPCHLRCFPFRNAELGVIRTDHKWHTSLPGLPPPSTQKRRPSRDVTLTLSQSSTRTHLSPRKVQASVDGVPYRHPSILRPRLALNFFLTPLTHTFSSFVSLRPALVPRSMYLRKDVVPRIHDVCVVRCWFGLRGPGVQQCLVPKD
ncbi:hypothetical protein EDB92DRAFT_634007 [Lactarius akahatsu]|uniref:Uncharacterized protein n=1 Tax=Lactarius akahatsu TaxID=416441 RepID=A0AAD4L7N1_9AGAM|nr:hypothetical protein EDB92DRAFT_634007 [Lactarius akahatsu]